MTTPDYAGYDLKRAEDKLAEAMKVIGQIDTALNDQFAAGIEEREGGSARRQERLMKSGEELRRAAHPRVLAAAFATAGKPEQSA